MIVGLLLVDTSFAYTDAELRLAKCIKKFDRSDSKLIQTAEKGSLKDLKIALNDSGVKINEVGQLSGMTALMYASRNGNKDMVALLLNKGACPHVRSRWGDNTALREAVKGNHKKIVKLLLDTPSKNSDLLRLSLGYALIEAAKNGYQDIVELLLANGADPNVKGDPDAQSCITSTTALIEASGQGHTNIVKLLLSKGANPNIETSATSTTALHQASSQGHTDIVKLLLANNADPNIRNIWGATALELAKREKHKKIIALFKGSTVALDDALMSAIVNGDAKAVKAHIDAGANVNTRDGNNNPALNKAAEKGYTEIVRILIDAGADVNATDAFGLTALFFAIDKGYVETVKILMAKGTAQDSKGLEDAFMSTVYRGNAELVEALLNERASSMRKDTLETACMMTRDKRIINAIKEVLQ